MNNNFEILKEEELKDINSFGYVYKHRTGAKLIYIKNKDINKVFSITFKTLPENNKGTAHIIEHSVLCGSKRYNMKDPFNELSKSTIHTYLNAITFLDKTMYPVASTNENDFITMINVYLDAVFFPLMYEREEIFLQEGWHYGQNGISGVVYNEMKGAFSVPNKIISYNLKKNINYKDEYRFYSGGIPEDIPKLTYQEFLKYHRDYYYPSNCILYLYGDIDIDKYLNLIDELYLSNFITKQNNLNKSIIKSENYIENNVSYYDIKDNKNLKGNNYMGVAFSIDNILNYDLVDIFDIIENIVIYNNTSLFKKALINSGFCKNISGYFDEAMFRPMFTLIAEKTDKTDINKFKEIIYSTFYDMVLKGIDKNTIKASINNLIFYLKEKDFGYRPKGLYYNILIMNSFNYGDDSFEFLKFEKRIRNIKNADYEKIIEKYILENKNCDFALLFPKNENIEKNTLNFKRNDEKLIKYHAKNDNANEISKIPLINLNDISKDIFHIKTEINFEKNTNFIYNYIDNDDIIYIDILFDTSKVSIELIQYINIMTYLFGRLETEKYDFNTLSNEINYYIGKFSIGFKTYDLKKNNEFLPCISINIRFLKQYYKKVFNLLEEVIFKTNFDDYKNIKKVLSEYKAKIEKNFILSESRTILRTLSYFSKRHYYKEKVNGIDFYLFLSKFLDGFENNFEMFKENINKLFKYIFNKNNMTVNITSNNKVYKDIKSEFDNFYRNINDDEYKKINIGFCSLKNEAFITDSKVQYNVKAGYFEKSAYNGHMYVLKKIISSDYLWNKIRVEGGAYGGGVEILKSGIMYFYSYRDPNIIKTYKYYDDIYKYIENLNFSKTDMQRYIIGTISNMDKPYKNSDIGKKSLIRFLAGINEKDLIKEREEIINTSINDINNFYNIIYDVLSQNYICTSGNNLTINLSNSIFNKIIEI